MADANLKEPVVVQALGVMASSLPAIFSPAYQKYVLSQVTDFTNVASKANEAGQGAYDSQVKNDQQDTMLVNHEIRISTSEGKIVTLRSDVDYLLDEVIHIESDMISKSSTSNQSVQAGGGSFLIGNVSSPTTDALQVTGSENVSVSYKVSGLPVVSQRKTGWTAATGTAYRGSFNTDAAMSVGSVYSQSEVQTIATNLTAALRRIKALEDDLRSHGLIN